MDGCGRRDRRHYRQLARHVPGRATQRRGRGSHCAQCRPARRRGPCRNGDALCQARRRAALPVGRRPRPRRRQDVGRQHRPAGRAPHRDVGARSVGARQIRPRRSGRGRRLGAGRLRIRPPVDRRGRGQELVPGHRGRVAGRRGARNDQGRRGTGAPRRTAIQGRRRQRRRHLRRARVGRHLPRRAASDRSVARTGDSRPRDPARPIPGGRGERHAEAAGPARRRCRRGSPPSSSSAGPT